MVDIAKWARANAREYGPSLLAGTFVAGAFLVLGMLAEKTTPPRGPTTEQIIELKKAPPRSEGLNRISMVDPDAPMTFQFTGPDGVAHVIVDLTTGRVATDLPPWEASHAFWMDLATYLPAVREALCRGQQP